MKKSRGNLQKKSKLGLSRLYRNDDRAKTVYETNQLLDQLADTNVWLARQLDFMTFLSKVPDTVSWDKLELPAALSDCMLKPDVGPDGLSLGHEPRYGFKYINPGAIRVIKAGVHQLALKSMSPHGNELVYWTDIGQQGCLIRGLLANNRQFMTWLKSPRSKNERSGLLLGGISKGVASDLVLSNKRWAKCPKCGDTVRNKLALYKHRRTLQCLRQTNWRSAKAGLVPVWGNSLTAAVAAGKIPGEIIMVKPVAFVPQAVIDIEQLWWKSKPEGIGLVDYISGALSGINPH
jgi:hypothetical protein